MSRTIKSCFIGRCLIGVVPRKLIAGFLILLASFACQGVSSADSLERQPLGTFYSTADVVALVQITSGEYDEANGASYRANVLRWFKGSQEIDEIRIGPYAGYRLGMTYLAFLTRSTGNSPSKRSVDCVSPSAIGEGELFLVVQQGLGMMDVECIYELNGSGVKVGPNAVIPKELQEFSKRGFVPQARVESYLLSLRASEKFAKDRH